MIDDAMDLVAAEMDFGPDTVDSPTEKPEKETSDESLQVADSGTDPGTDSVAGDDTVPVGAVEEAAGDKNPDLYKDAPKSWRSDAASHWSTLNETVKGEILKREEDILKGLGSYKEEATFGRSVRDVLNPYLPVLRQYNIDPVQQVAGLLQAHHTLALGSPQQKQQMLRKVIDDYGIDISSFTDNYTVEQEYIDPKVTALEQRLAHFEAGAQRNSYDAVTQQVTAFADQKKPYFDELINDMTSFVQRGVSTTLEDAYEKALWTNPVVRAKEVVRLQTEASAKQAATKQGEVSTARKLQGANINTKPKVGDTTITKKGSMDETLDYIYEQIQGRG